MQAGTKEARMCAVGFGVCKTHNGRNLVSASVYTGSIPTARDRLNILNQQINDARRAIDERRSLVRLMGQQGEDTEDAHRLLGHLQHSLNDMIEFRDQVLRELERTGG